MTPGEGFLKDVFELFKDSWPFGNYTSCVTFAGLVIVAAVRGKKVQIMPFAALKADLSSISYLNRYSIEHLSFLHMHLCKLLQCPL